MLNEKLMKDYKAWLERKENGQTFTEAQNRTFWEMETAKDKFITDELVFTSNVWAKEFVGIAEYMKETGTAFIVENESTEAMAIVHFLLSNGFVAEPVMIEKRWTISRDEKEYQRGLRFTVKK